ncbi:pyruvate kinase [Patescibacteria group bacterium]|nr:pyruvate kinase [Patescibacteria group bacterium]MBU1705108.1 pyruvate kinase [Patescibacteria group bacterium]
MKRTKIVCTIGPASAQPATLKAMMKSGLNVARLNFSHGTHQSHEELIKLIRTTSQKLGLPVAILGDLQGPKIRLGDLPEAGVKLKNGEVVQFSTAVSNYQSGGALPLTYKGLHQDLKKGHRFLIDDGLLELVVIGIKGRVISAKVINGGVVTSHKGMNFPDSTLSVSPITAKDKKDVEFAVKQGVDWLALSFVTSAKNILDLRRLIKKAAKKNQVLPRIIVKIEKHEAIDHFDEILAVVDGVMVARGDLGIEIPAEEVPIRQKEIIEKCRLAGKPVVVATQMMDSMIRNPRPTRAEVSDVANAVFDHTDAVMLSGESATGKYPVKAVKLMAKIVTEAEASPYDDVAVFRGRTQGSGPSLASILKILAADRQIDGVIAMPQALPWSEHLLMFHPEIPLFLVTKQVTVQRQNYLRWGVWPVLVKSKISPRILINQLKKQKLVKRKMRLAVVENETKKTDFDIISL